MDSTAENQGCRSASSAERRSEGFTVSRLRIRHRAGAERDTSDGKGYRPRRIRANNVHASGSAKGYRPTSIVVGASSAYVLHRRAACGGDAPPAPEDLHAYVRRKRRLAEREAARLFAQALEAVAHCHRHGVVVRDVKLRRFLFADADRTLLQLDGLYDALVFNGSDDLLTDKHGCLAYVSPEILDATFTGASATPVSDPRTRVLPASSGSYAGRPADMWSLGVMLYTMLVGRYPFADPDACTLFARIRRGRYPLPSEVSLSAPARCLIRSLLTVNPSDRLSAEEALRHPWFSAVESVPVTPAVSNQASDDGVVPQLPFEKVDKMFVE